jgi:hypothetical protein
MIKRRLLPAEFLHRALLNPSQAPQHTHRPRAIMAGFDDASVSMTLLAVSECYVYKIPP